MADSGELALEGAVDLLHDRLKMDEFFQSIFPSYNFLLKQVKKVGKCKFFCYTTMIYLYFYLCERKCLESAG
jgi:hypothetical protein